MPSGGAVITLKAKTLGKASMMSKVNGIKAAITQRMHQFNADAMNKVTAYPPPNSSYNRTGKYGGGWNAKVIVEANAITGRVSNGAIRYAVYVGGPLKGGKGERQTAVMAGKGWVSVTTALKESWATHRREFSKILLLSGRT